MLIKWVACRAVDRAGFHRGQLAWAALRGLPGFLGQCGGWSRRADRRAHVFGWWADEPSYRAFMAAAHDGLAAAQSGTYDAIDVRLFDHRSGVGQGIVAGDGLLRLTHCRVGAARRADFVRARAAAWSRPGMLGGTVAQRGDREFLVLSRWRSTVDHDRFTGDLIDLDPAWTVPG